ncbi:hypothetical protein F2Q70_00020321 [Brassica cretica]|uniref:Uncharacterized protein n=1 Tax=Brassica cretica TaxID=69181 RepID=A0A8S9GKD6_BRACR|nr:hypothetical protein F2Q70_00020321 [Brassica cretica]
MAGLLIPATHFHSGDVGWYRGCGFEWFTVQIRRGRSFGLVLGGDSGGFKEKFSSVDEDDGKLHVFPVSLSSIQTLSRPTKLRRVTALSPVSGGASERVPAPEEPLSLPSFSPLLLLCLFLPSDMLAVLGLVCGSEECSVRKERLSLAPHTFSGAAVRRTQGSVEVCSYYSTSAVSTVEWWSLSVAVVGSLVFSGVGEVHSSCLLPMTVKGSRLWLLDGFSRLRLASDISLMASCPVLWFGSGLFLSGAASWCFIVKSLRLTPKFGFHSQVNGLSVLDNWILGLTLLAGDGGFLTGCGDGINPIFCTVRGGNGGGVSCYSGDDTGVPGIRGNEENLTVLWSSSMVENGN